MEVKLATAVAEKMAAELKFSKLEATSSLEKELAVAKAKLLAGGMMLNANLMAPPPPAPAAGAAAVTPGSGASHPTAYGCFTLGFVLATPGGRA